MHVIKPVLFKSTSIISRCFKVQNKKIVIDNFFGRGFGDNPKYIAEELLRIDPTLDIVWLVNNSVDYNQFPNGIRLIKYGSLRSIYELATAHIWIDNIKNNYKGRKRKNQFYLQTWHGGIGFKKVERAAQSTLSLDYIKASKKDSGQTDLMISDSKWVTDNYRKNFWYSGDIEKTGIPRNDIFYQNPQKIIKKVKTFYNIEPQTEIILYAPTFRNNMSIKEQGMVCSFNEVKLVKAFERKFKRKFVLIKRMHPNVANSINIKETDILKDGSKYSDMQELLVASFALITDFSSCAFDFMLKSNKVFLYAKDYKRFLNKERGLLINPTKNLPFYFAHSESELLSNVARFDNELTYKRLDRFKSSVELIDDGKASERVAKIILSKIKNK